MIEGGAHDPFAAIVREIERPILIRPGTALIDPNSPSAEARLRARNAAGAKTRTRNGKAATPTPWGLTACQFHILARLADGTSQVDVAKERGIATKTVAVHLYRIRDKMGVGRTAHAVETFAAWKAGCK